MNLDRIRWGVRGVLTLGVAASVAANILHARANPISQTIAAWPPVALLITIELVAKVPAQTRRTVVARVLATVAIAGIAAWVSYWHMAGVASRYGEERIAAHLLPLSVDGLIVVASVTLVELAARIRTLEAAQHHDEPPAAQVPEPSFLSGPGHGAAAQPAPEPSVQPPTQVGANEDHTNETPHSVGATKPVTQPVRSEPARTTAPGAQASRPAASPSPHLRGERSHPLRSEVLARIAAGETDLRALRASLNGNAPSLRSMQIWARELREANGG